MGTQVFRSTLAVLGAIVLKDWPVERGEVQRGDVIPYRDGSRECVEVISPSLCRYSTAGFPSNQVNDETVCLNVEG